MAAGKHSRSGDNIRRSRGSKRKDPRLDSRTIGTHVSRGAPSGSIGRHGSGISEVQVGTVPIVAETSNPRKKRNVTLAEQLQGKVHKRHRIAFIVAFILIVLLAVSVGVFAYFKTANEKLDLKPSNATESLVAAEDGQPSYMLCCAVIGSANDHDDETKMGYMLIRMDSDERSLAFTAIPANLQVRISNGDYYPLYQTHDKGGDAETVKALAAILDIEISHFAYTSADKLGDMVDLMGGVTVDIVEEVDDPNAGIEVLFPGEQEINGDQAEVLLRAQNFNAGFDMVAHNRVAFTLALAAKALANDGPGLTTVVGDAGDYVSTDLDAAALLDLGDIFRPIDTVKIYECVLPGYESEDLELGETVFVRDRDTWGSMLEAMNAGQDPNDVDASPVNVDPSSFTVEVRNGTTSNGAASKLADLLKSMGYTIKGIGNAEDGVSYPETMIVYTDEKYEGAARAVAQSMGTGRIVNGGDFYSSEANVIAIIGGDYTPLQ